MINKKSHLIEFYGITCPHCEAIKSTVSEAEKELGVKIDKREVWENEENRQLMEKYFDKLSEACGGFPGVPSFINTQTNQALCGEQDKETIKLWASGADCSGNVCAAHSKIKK